MISLVVTTASIIFFFAGRHFFPNIVNETRTAWGVITQRVVEWGGVRLKTIELQLVANQTADQTPSEEQGKRMAPFEALSAQLKEDLNVYYGSPFWSLDLDHVKQKIMNEGWVKSVYLRRSFPESLKIQIIPKEPTLLVRASEKWVAVDNEGSPLWMSSQIPGSWLNLPIVFGLERIFDRGKTLIELKRQVTDETDILKDAYQLLSSLHSRVGVDVESVSIKDEAWSQGALFTVKFSLPNKTIEKSNETKYEVTFLSNQWTQRVASLQFILSDISTKADNKNIDNKLLALKKLEPIRILGQYDGRWIVEGVSEPKTVTQVKTVYKKNMHQHKKRARRYKHANAATQHYLGKATELKVQQVLAMRAGD